MSFICSVIKEIAVVLITTWFFNSKIAASIFDNAVLIVSQASTPEPGSVGPSYTTVLDKGLLVSQEVV
jgi:hypothetical protein